MKNTNARKRNPLSLTRIFCLICLLDALRYSLASMRPMYQRVLPGASRSDTRPVHNDPVPSILKEWAGRDSEEKQPISS